MSFDMNAGRKRKTTATTTEEQIELREQLKQRNQTLDAAVTPAAPVSAPGGSPASVSVGFPDGENTANGAGEQPAAGQPVPTGLAAEKPCFITVAIPESIKRIADIKVRYDSKELPQYNQTMKHVGRRWFLRGLLAEGLITQEQFDEAAALYSEYGWERDRVAAKRRRT